MIHYFMLSAALMPVLSVDVPVRQDGFEGPWQQIETTAGACPTCRINISSSAGLLKAMANNGWSAGLRVVDDSTPDEAVGRGIWSNNNRGWVGGRPFQVTFRLVEQRLHMKMSVEMADGSQRHITAIFERVWMGAGDPRQISISA